MVSEASRASRLADFRMSRRAVSACVTASLARLIAAPWVLRSSGDILPSVASKAEIEPFLPSAATRTASRAASSPAAAISARTWDSSWARSVMAILFSQDAEAAALARHARGIACLLYADCVDLSAIPGIHVLRRSRGRRGGWPDIQREDTLRAF